MLTAARTAGGRLAVVDAIDAAARFYQHHDFEVLASNPERLVQKLSTIAAALNLPWSGHARRHNDAEVAGDATG
jgi:hypothetical protein